MPSFALDNLVLQYFESWRHTRDLDAMQACLSDKLVFETGDLVIRGKEDFIGFLQNRAPHWEDITLLESIIEGHEAALCYEGRAENKGQRFRVAEFIEFSDGLIDRIRVVIAPLGDSLI